MKPGFARIRIHLVILAVGGIVACSDAQTVATPQSLTVMAGDNQTGTPGQALPSALEVRVSDGDQRPYAGASVRWNVVSGDAEVDPATSTTDVLGIAATTLRLGTAAEVVVVEAQVDGLATVSFSATSLAECATADFEIGAPVQAALTSQDCLHRNGSASHNYNLTLAEPLSLLVTQTSTAFDTYLQVNDASGRLVAFNDDTSNDESDSALRVFLAPGQYLISASGQGPDDLGEYTLSATIDDSPVTDCAFLHVWVVTDVQVEQELSGDDCALSDQAGNVYYADPYLLHLEEGTTVTLTQTSADMDPYLELYAMTPDGFAYIGFGDGSGEGTARITYTAPVTTVYLLLPSSAGNRETGGYTLTIE